MLLAVWIGYDQRLKPGLSSLSRLRSLSLFFGKDFSRRSTVYKFVRAFESSTTNNRWTLSRTRTFIIIFLGLLYALIPGLTRLALSDFFFGENENYYVEIGALLSNFVMVSAVIYLVEIQYTKNLDNIRKWMSDITVLLFNSDPDDRHSNDDQLDNTFHKDLFLSFRRKQNALGWLEIRSFLAVQGQIMFAEQETPTLWLIIVGSVLSIFCVYEAYINLDAALESILFNGVFVLTIICLIALSRILINAFQFQGLQSYQEKLITEQKFYIRCNRPFDDLMLDSRAVGMLEYQRSQQSKSRVLESNPLHHEKGGGDMEMNELNTVPIKFDQSSEQKSSDMVDDNNEEESPLLSIQEKVTKIGKSSRDSYDVGFVDDILLLVQQKDIFPRLFKLRLTSILSKVVPAIFLAVIATAFRVFVTLV